MKRNLDFSHALRYNPMVLNIWTCIEVVITGLTRNQVALTGSWVRIPPRPPEILSFLYQEKGRIIIMFWN